MIKESEFQQLRKRLANNLRLLQGTKTSDEMANILCVSRGTYLSRLKILKSLQSMKCQDCAERSE